MMRRLGSLAVIAVSVIAAVPLHSQDAPSRVVDVLIVYPPSAASALSTIESTTYELKAPIVVAAMNDALARSQAITRIRLVGVVQVAEGNTVQFFAGTSPYDTIDALRETHGADLVVYATTGPSQGARPTPAHPFSRTEYRATVNLLGRNSFLHELGHNFGLNHQSAAAPTLQAGIAAYQEPLAGFVPSYANGVHLRGLAPLGAPTRTVMADDCAGCDYQEYFPNAQLTVSGVVMGNAVTADAVRAIDENAPFIAAYSDQCAYTVSPAATTDDLIQVPMTGGSYSFTIATSASCLTGVRVQDVPWLTVTSSPLLHAKGNGAVAFTAAANTSGAPREAFAFIGNRRVRLSQYAACQADQIEFVESPLFVPAALPDGRSPVPVRVGVRSSIVSCYPVVTSDQAWLSDQTVNTAVGGRAVALPFSAQVNKTANARSATVTIAGKALTITQAAGACPLTLPVSVVLAGSGSTSSRQETIAGDSSCNWTASTADSWLTLGSSQSASGAGGATMTVAATANSTGAMRTGAVTINGVSVPVFQLTGTTDGCTWSATRTPSSSLPAAAGTFSIALTTGAACPWAARSAVPWMSVAGAATGVGPATITVSIDANPGLAREDTFAVSSTHVLVQQSASSSPCATTVSADPASFGAAGGSGTLQVQSPAGCEWTMGFRAGTDSRPMPDWLTLEKATAGIGTTSITFSVASTDGATRAIEITAGLFGVGIGSGVISQTGPLGSSCAPGPLRTVTLSAGVHAMHVRSLAGPGCSLSGRVSGMSTWGFYGPTFTTNYTDIQPLLLLVPEHGGGRTRTADVLFGDVPAVRVVQQPRVACDFALASSTLSIDSTSTASGSVAVTTLYDCAWQPTVPSWLTVERTGGSGWEGNGTLVVRAASANTTGSARSVALTVGNKTLTVTQQAAPGPLTIAPQTLRFSAVRGAGGAITSSTPPQSVTMTFSGAPSSWSATTTAPWISVSPASGQTSSQMTVTVDPAGLQANTSAVITVATPNAPVTSQTISVTLEITSTPQAPVGQVDTPAQNATGVQGAIGVTGWVLDDIGVTGVKIYRNCLSFDNQASCQMVLGNNVVEVGDAAFLAGARTDVESAFSSFPQNNRAGWGYLMLTSMLPHVTNQQQYGGQGALTLYAVATDVEGHRKLLGRSSDPASAEFATPTQITMANEAIAKPFGAIDTPAQGQTVSGLLNNFGWALTPDSNTTGGEGGDILIPTDGSTMTVFIDGLPVALVAYNQCRGSVGNPVPSGQFCNDDVSNIFGNTTPAAVLTTRTSNPTRHRNLDAGRSAIGVYSFNTATLTNGLHTIAWSVTDSAGRTEGIGSRFFIVLNSGADPRRPH